MSGIGYITLLKLEVVTCSVSYINTLWKALPYRWFGLILTHTALGTRHTSVPGVGAKGRVLFLVAEPCCLWFLYRRGWITVLRMYLMEAWWVSWLPSYRKRNWGSECPVSPWLSDGAETRCPFQTFPVQWFLLYYTASGTRHILYSNPCTTKSTPMAFTELPFQ